MRSKDFIRSASCAVLGMGDIMSLSSGEQAVDKKARSSGTEAAEE